MPSTTPAATGWERTSIGSVSFGGPILAQAVEANARAGAQGQSWRGVTQAERQEIRRGVKRKALPIAAAVVKKSAKASVKKGYGNTVGRLRDALGV